MLQSLLNIDIYKINQVRGLKLRNQLITARKKTNILSYLTYHEFILIKLLNIFFHVQHER